MLPQSAPLSRGYFTHAILGFSLVELSLALLVIALVVGGLMLGRSLSTAGDATALANTARTLSEAIIAFEEIYGRLPGDVNRDGQIGGLQANRDAAGWAEVAAVMKDLKEAGLISGDFSDQVGGTPTAVLTEQNAFPTPIPGVYAIVEYAAPYEKRANYIRYVRFDPSTTDDPNGLASPGSAEMIQGLARRMGDLQGSARDGFVLAEGGDGITLTGEYVADASASVARVYVNTSPDALLALLVNTTPSSGTSSGSTNSSSGGGSSTGTSSGSSSTTSSTSSSSSSSTSTSTSSGSSSGSSSTTSSTSSSSSSSTSTSTSSGSSSGSSTSSGGSSSSGGCPCAGLGPLEAVNADCLVDGGTGQCTDPCSAGDPEGTCNQCCKCFPARVMQCFHPMTEIVLADGKTTRKAMELKTGDRLLNPLTNKAVTIGKIVAGPEQDPLVEITAGGHVLKVNRKHPMVTESGLKQASTLLVTDRLVDAKGKWVAIESLRNLPVEEGQFVINFDVSDSPHWRDHVVISGGLLSADRWVQDELTLNPTQPAPAQQPAPRNDSEQNVQKRGQP
jgi:hypothetical protein